MRHRRARRFTALSFLTAAALAPRFVPAAQGTPAAQAEPAAQEAPAAADTVSAPGILDLLRGAARPREVPDTIQSARKPPRASRGLAAPIEMGTARKLGAASLEDAVRLRRAALLAALPVFGPTQGSIRLPDGGGSIRLSEAGDDAVHTTDETLIGSAALGWGTPTLAHALDDPRGDALEALDLDRVDFPLGREAFRGPGDALARPVAFGPAFERKTEGIPRDARSKTSLFYRKGGGDELATGVRFLSSAWGRRIYGSYARLQADGLSPLRRTVSARHDVQVELPRLLGHYLNVEGRLFDRMIEDSIGGVGEWERRGLVLAASREGDSWSDLARIRLSREKRTWVVSPDGNLSPEAGSRERWQFPAISLETSVAWRPSPALTWIAAAQAASQRVVYRVDSIPEFDPRRGEARVHLGVRHPMGPNAGAGADVAYDARETQPGILDARASWWGGTERLRARVDLESAHERPSWIDLLTPTRTREFYPAIQNTQVTLTRLLRSGDPLLRPRRLAGILGSASVIPRREFRLDVSGSFRRFTDDFGWELEAAMTGDTLLVASIARRRGDGWVSHASVGWEIRAGALHASGVGWIRGGPDALSPRGGSPPRRALDAAVDGRVVLFQGDLPVRFGIEAHARGPRRGAQREPSQVTWDGSLSGDFGAAGVFLRFENVFDREIGSAVWDPLRPAGAPLPGRSAHFGFVWNLVD